MDVERALIWKAVQAGEIHEVISRGINADHFADEDCRDVFEWAVDFAQEFKQSPSVAVLKEEFPKFKANVSKDPLSYHLERFVNKVKERMAVELVRGFHDAIEDPHEIPHIELRALEMARALTEVVPAPRATRFSEGPERAREYDRRKETGELHGILLGIQTLDEEMLGLQPHELATIVAYMGVGKSILMAFIAYSAYLQGKTSLFISLEMEAEALLRRIDVMASNVKYHALKALELDQGDRKKWEQILERAHEDRHERDIIIRDDIPNCTADHVWAETWRYKPELVLVDYLELMKTPRGVASQHWEKVSFSGMQLKQNARTMKIPVITAAQLSRDGGRGEVTLANVGYQSVGKHSDIVIGLNQNEELEERQEMECLLLKMRDGRKKRTTLRWQLDRMDIGELGVEERFPARVRKSGSLLSHERHKARQLEVARSAGVAKQDGKASPWADLKKRKRGETHQKNPFSGKKVKA
jgi:DnaB-like helicase C terminal domain